MNKRAAVAAPQRVLHQPINLTEFHPDSEEDFIKGIYPIEAEDEVARNPDFFSLTVFDIQKGVCDRIMDSGYEVPSAIAVNSEVQQAGSTCEGSEDGKYDVTFIFDITLGNKEYEECEVDSDCPTDDICNQITGTCMQQPIVYIYDRNNIPHACNYSKIITLQAISGTSAEKEEKRLANIADYCTRACQAGEFMVRDGKCYPCDTFGSYTLSSLNNVTQYCSSVCPGQRFRNASGGCEQCPEGYYSQGSDATECQACPDDVSGLEEGACIACGRTYINGECQSCADGEYSRNGVCTTCPEDLSTFSGATVNQIYCHACGANWDTLEQKCCPIDLTTIKTQQKCQQCYGLWANGACSQCEGGHYPDNTTGVCRSCPTDGSTITNEGNCYECGYDWNDSTETCSAS